MEYILAPIHVNIIIFQLSNTSTIQQLSNVTSSMMTLQSACESHRRTQSDNINATQREMEQFYSTLREEMNGQEELEEKCLKEEFKVYSPTGKIGKCLK